MARPRLRRRARAAEEPTAAAPAAGPPAAGSPPPPAGPPGPAPAPEARPHERIDGLRAWTALLDRRLSLRTYVLGAIGLLALAAGVVAIVLVLELKQDAATDDDVAALGTQLSGLEQSASQTRRSARSVDQRLTDLQTEVDALSSQQTTTKRELRVVQDDIKELRSQVSSSPSSRGPRGGTGGSSIGAGGTFGAP